MHGVISVVALLAMGAWTAVENGQGIAGSVSSAEIPSVSATTVHEHRYETPVRDGRDVIQFGVIAGEQAGFHVGHDPRPIAVAAAPGSGSAVIGGLHSAGTHGAAISRRVAVVKAAAAVKMFPVDDIVDPFRFVIDRQAAGVVAAVAHSGHNIDAIDFLPVQQGGGHVGDGTGVETAFVRPLEGSRRSWQQVVAQPGLVVNHGNIANRVCAEGVLRRSIGDAVLLRENVERRSVTLTDHLIERTVVLGVEKSGSTVCGDTGRAAFPVDVAGAFVHSGKPFAGKDRSEKYETDDGREENLFHHGHSVALQFDDVKIVTFGHISKSEDEDQSSSSRTKMESVGLPK